ncbi:MAG: DUF2807 domain-containing protein [Pedobacter sp.]|nr:MAG: DUF2807 domain-containing protein [Pedobacter sp.]
MRTKQILLNTFVACLILLSTACQKERLKPDGNILVETRELSPFKSITSNAAVHITYQNAPYYKIQLKGSDNLLAALKTEIKNQELRIGFRDANISHSDVKVWIYGPYLEEAIITSSEDFELRSTFPAQEEFSAIVTGSGDFRVLGKLQTKKLKVKLTGSGDVDVENIKSTTADLHITGTGNILADVERNLNAYITGTGNIFYKGDPIMFTSITGTGRVLRKN